MQGGTHWGRTTSAHSVQAFCINTRLLHRRALRPRRLWPPTGSRGALPLKSQLCPSLCQPNTPQSSCSTDPDKGCPASCFIPTVLVWRYIVESSGPVTIWINYYIDEYLLSIEVYDFLFINHRPTVRIMSSEVLFFICFERMLYPFIYMYICLHLLGSKTFKNTQRHNHWECSHCRSVVHKCYFMIIRYCKM